MMISELKEKNLHNLDQGATPDVEGVYFFRTSDDATVINFLNGEQDQEITIVFEHTKIIECGDYIRLTGHADFCGTQSDILILTQKGGIWFELWRCVNLE